MVVGDCVVRRLYTTGEVLNDLEIEYESETGIAHDTRNYKSLVNVTSLWLARDC